ncbi:hypothetical protein SAMN05660473_00721 [Arthrobacter sp. 49Tsu3.1M3]|uniref:hypothetical protein n=1 Tax=Arthrobacter sp. 49Tsu3.1M3 TaxID=1279029 RepID=UPI0009A5831D|nr:hypothetical protein [Arthrobacter sp. 49Tsu3.1M3]SKB44220.1 hypothetical protein SAMN05660473_00721 [Arthrobacter sp. 49Tsu3.1M3]
MARKKGGSAAGLVGLGLVGVGPWGFLFAAAVVYYFWWFFLIIIGLVALTACYISVRRARAKVESKPVPVVKPPKPAPEKPKEPAPPVYWPKWDGTHKWAVGQDKDEWDHAFDEIIKNAEERAEGQSKPQPVEVDDVYAQLRARLEQLGAETGSAPAPPAASAEGDVYARLRSRLGQLG